jgi:hypothetical protein
MTYGEFVQRRASIQAQIRAAQKVYATAIDTRYTPLSQDGARIAWLAVKTSEEKLNQLVSDWQTQQSKLRGVK